ncbi:MAG: NAD(P)H-hydrate dehydratase [Sphingosinicella sp.]
MSGIAPIGHQLLRRMPLPAIGEDWSKEDRGRLLVVAGSRELAGAAELAGLAALRAGAGKLQIATSERAAAALGPAMPEARVIPLAETADGSLAGAGIAPLLAWAGEAQAVLVGCGMQEGPALSKLLAALAALEAQRPLILDAAAFGCLEGLEPAFRGRTGATVMLPRAGELAGLLACAPEIVAAEPLVAARAASELHGAIVLVKGPQSHVAAPDGRTFRLEGGGVGLATSGSGDVLAGLTGGLCARGADPLVAVLWAAWIHAEAGRALATRIGRVGFLARELVDEIPALLPDNRRV